ncbi:hypothetical protein LPTSP4_22980 [Leptospira ryugenii]|uniref:Uncharacterized protein n=1 Tax=Leptospira ryugenii TaxID=1917863 RepID=A0A2P2E1L7_9LEPT|nr:hypothetical protein [Leptospira ryugenii]GBF50771.1 hypothetical protein LPTSP4_22980 [Leptospira ryugenii]
MLYAALAMILVGVLCFLYVSLSPNQGKPSLPTKRPQADRISYSSNFRHSPNPQVSPQIDERIRRDREIADIHAHFSDPNRPLAVEVPAPAVVEKSSVLVDSEAGFQEMKESPQILVHDFQMEGTLYMDHSGRIPFGEKDLSHTERREEELRNFKRVGQAKLREEEGKFVFYSGNVSFTYNAFEIDQIVFYQEAVVFLLKDTRAPKPIYFTDGMDELKDFLTQAERS